MVLLSLLRLYKKHSEKHSHVDVRQLYVCVVKKTREYVNSRMKRHTHLTKIQLQIKATLILLMDFRRLEIFQTGGFEKAPRKIKTLVSKKSEEAYQFLARNVPDLQPSQKDAAALHLIIQRALYCEIFSKRTTLKMCKILAKESGYVASDGSESDSVQNT